MDISSAEAYHRFAGGTGQLAAVSPPLEHFGAAGVRAVVPRGRRDGLLHLCLHMPLKLLHRAPEPQLDPAPRRNETQRKG